MKLPIILAENVKSLMARWVNTGVRKSPMFFCPTLGIYEKDLLVTTDYVAVTSTDIPVNVPVFSPDPPISIRRKLPTGEFVWEPQVEAPINFIDGSSGSNYVFINDQARLKTLCTLWNEWLQRLATYSCTLSVLSKDFGVNVCSSVGMTSHWIPADQSIVVRDTSVRDPRIVARRHLSSTVYAGRNIIATSSHDRINSPVFDQINKLWILASNKAVPGGDLSNQSLFQRQQLISGESFSLTQSNEINGAMMSLFNAQYAEMMVKGPNAPANEIEAFFLECAKKGQGGILSGLVAGFLGNTFGPDIGSLAGTVSELLPI